MDTVTIPTKEYRRLLGIKRTPKRATAKKRKDSSDIAFGILKGSFRNISSISYMTKLRKAWRGA